MDITNNQKVSEINKYVWKGEDDESVIKTEVYYQPRDIDGMITIEP